LPLLHLGVLLLRWRLFALVQYVPWVGLLSLQALVRPLVVLLLMPTFLVFVFTLLVCPPAAPCFVARSLVLTEIVLLVLHPPLVLKLLSSSLLLRHSGAIRFTKALSLLFGRIVSKLIIHTMYYVLF
jgi:hypothetical protein